MSCHGGAGEHGGCGGFAQYEQKPTYMDRVLGQHGYTAMETLPAQNYAHVEQHDKMPIVLGQKQSIAYAPQQIKPMYVPEAMPEILPERVGPKTSPAREEEEYIRAPAKETPNTVVHNREPLEEGWLHIDVTYRGIAPELREMQSLYEKQADLERRISGMTQPTGLWQEITQLAMSH